MKEKNYTAHYAAIQGLYWMANSLLVSYAAVFFGDKGFSSTKIGVILAVSSLVAVLVQPVVASYIDKSDKVTVRAGMVAVGIVAIVLSALMLCLQSVLIVVPVLFVLIYTCFATLQPLNNTIGMECVDYGNKLNFGLGRGLGSWCFAILTVVMGYYLLVASPKTIPGIYLVIFILYTVVVFTFTYKDLRINISSKHEDIDEEAHTSILEFAKCYPSFMFFLVGVVLIFYGHMLVNNFAINLFENLGGNSKDMGIGVGFAAFLELPAMVFVTKFKDKISVKTMLIFSAASFFVRHFLFWVSSSVIMLIAVHGLQMFAYAVFATASVYYINDMMGKRDAVKGQAYSIIALTIGGIFSSLIGGRMIDSMGVNAALCVGVIATGIGSVIMILALVHRALVSKKKDTKSND